MDTDNIKWEEVKGFPLYEIHPTDGIKRKGKKQVLKGRNWFGYPKVTLMRDGVKHEKRIHKLVGEHFVPNPNNLPIVNHINSDRANHRYDNLEWVSNSGNQLHRWATQKAGLKKKKYTKEYGMTIEKPLQIKSSTNTPLKKAAQLTRIKRLRAKKALEAKGLSPAKLKKMRREEEYKAAGMGPARRAINHMLPLNFVL
jgi:hypothetical protein